MKIFRDASTASSNPPFTPTNSVVPFETSTTASDAKPAPARDALRSLGEGWKRLSTGLHTRGARLYRITLPTGGVYWMAEALERGRVLSRRFASELHARAWLANLLQPAQAHVDPDAEELHERFRLHGLVHGH